MNTYIISYEQDGNELNPNWNHIDIQADSESEAEEKFDKMGIPAFDMEIKLKDRAA